MQGPNAQATLQKLTEIDLSAIPYYHFKKGKFAGLDNILISNTGYTGAGGFEIYFENEVADKVWDAVFKAGGAQAIGAFAFGTKTIPRVDKIVGPGNAYVAEAKRQAFGYCDIDMVAGPTEVVILAGDDPASQVYVRNKIKACSEAGIESELIRLEGARDGGRVMAAASMYGYSLNRKSVCAR